MIWTVIRLDTCRIVSASCAYRVRPEAARLSIVRVSARISAHQRWNAHIMLRMSQRRGCRSCAYHAYLIDIVSNQCRVAGCCIGVYRTFLEGVLVSACIDVYHVMIRHVRYGGCIESVSSTYLLVSYEAAGERV